jgi:hypothetical protein
MDSFVLQRTTLSIGKSVSGAGRRPSRPTARRRRGRTRRHDRRRTELAPGEMCVDARMLTMRAEQLTPLFERDPTDRS